MSNIIQSYSAVGNDGSRCKIDIYQNEGEYYGVVLSLPNANTNSVTSARRFDADPSNTEKGAIDNVTKFLGSTDFNRWLRGELR